jgi:hydrogenase expression/formation protein HypC
MCLALPAKVLKLQDANMATVEVGGVHKDISLGLLERVAVGDYVIVHVGYALSRIDEEEARNTLAMFAEIEQRFSREGSP